MRTAKAATAAVATAAVATAAPVAATIATLPAVAPQHNTAQPQPAAAPAATYTPAIGKGSHLMLCAGGVAMLGALNGGPAPTHKGAHMPTRVAYVFAAAYAAANNGAQPALGAVLPVASVTAYLGAGNLNSGHLCGSAVATGNGYSAKKYASHGKVAAIGAAVVKAAPTAPCAATLAAATQLPLLAVIVAPQA
jgi:hypothetical protein